MEQARQPDVSERIAGFAMADPYELSMPSIRGYAAGLLDTGYPREALYEDLVRARDLLSERGAPDEAEDAVVDVSDFLAGWSSSFMKL